MQSAETGDPLVAGPEIEVIRVGQDDRRAHGSNIVWIEGFDGGVGAHGHELRRFHDAVGQRQATQSGPSRSVGGRLDHDLELSG
jgi:hypothetical protein